MVFDVYALPVSDNDNGSFVYFAPTAYLPTILHKRCASFGFRSAAVDLCREAFSVETDPLSWNLFYSEGNRRYLTTLLPKKYAVEFPTCYLPQAIETETRAMAQRLRPGCLVPLAVLQDYLYWQKK